MLRKADIGPGRVPRARSDTLPLRSEARMNWLRCNLASQPTRPRGTPRHALSQGNSAPVDGAYAVSEVVELCMLRP